MDKSSSSPNEPIHTTNDKEAMMKKSEDEEEEDEECSTPDENATARCFQGVADGAATTSKALLEKSLSQASAHIGAAQQAHQQIHKQLKRNYACICIFAFLIGTDFAVIIPTLWDRLNIDYEASGAFMGLVLSSYSLSGVICGLIMGKISDEINKTKVFLFISIFFGIAGHLLYFVGVNKWVILLGRVISGLCLGASTVLLAYIAKTSNERQRTSVISLVMASRQIGLMLAPAFNLFLRKFNFYLFDTILVDRKSSPGAFMAILWALSLLLVLTLYKEFYPNTYRNADSPTQLNSDESSEDEKFSSRNKNIYKKEFMRVEIFILLGVTFFTYFNQTSLETIVIPFTEIMFGWSELENSILFCIGGIVIIASYVVIRVLSKRLTDRWIMLIGLATIATGLIIACACLPFAQQFSSTNVRLFIRRAREEAAEKRSFRKWQTSFIPDDDESDTNFPHAALNLTRSTLVSNFNSSKAQTNSSSVYHDYQLFPAFAVFVALDVLGLPAIAICSASLFTKLIDNKVQGIGQGIQRGILGVGTIFGPLLAGPLIYKPVILLAITLSFILVILFLLLIFFKHFLVVSPAVDNQPSSSSKPLKA